jgi:hypothetical protein
LAVTTAARSEALSDIPIVGRKVVKFSGAKPG